jgi:hypothetical protein
MALESPIFVAGKPLPREIGVKLMALTRYLQPFTTYCQKKPNKGLKTDERFQVSGVSPAAGLKSGQFNRKKN